MTFSSLSRYCDSKLTVLQSNIAWAVNHISGGQEKHPLDAINGL